MNLLQSLTQGIQGVERAIGGKRVQAANIIQPGHKLSPAVEAMNAAPVQNQFNAQGQPTYEVLSNDAGAHMLPRPMPGLASHLNFQPQLQVRPSAYPNVQLSGDNPYQVQNPQSVQDMQPQRSNVQPGSFYMQGVQPQPYNQQSLLSKIGGRIQ